MNPAELLNNTPSGQLFLALDGTLLFANESFRKTALWTGASPAPNFRFQDFLTPGGAIFYETQFAPTLLLRGTASEISLDLVRRDGTRVPVLINAVLAHHANGAAQGVIMAVFEATQRKQYEAELLRSRRDLEQIAEVVRRSSDAILSLTAAGLIQSWNSGAEQIFGYSSTEVIGQELTTLFAPAQAAPLREAMEELSLGAEINRDIIAIAKNGTAVEVAVTLTPHLEPPGIMVAFSAIIRDITARKQAERALLQNEKLASVGRLASSIAHEINNPLESVTNLLYILQTRVGDDETRALVTTAQEELARVSHIATHTLKFHKQSSARSLLHLTALTDSVLSLYKARLQNAGIRISHHCDAASPLFCFEGELRQVLVNIVSNAFDAMRGGGRLVLRCRDTILQPGGNPGVRITVADTGSGMDALTLRRLFEPFFSTKGIGGTGLGMWITKDLVQKNDGTIQVRSHTGPGPSGTVVSMCFPHRTPTA